MTNLTTYTHNGMTFLIHDGPSAAAERDIIHEVERAYEWDFSIHTAIDVGAHIGAWTKYAKQRHPDARVVAVEVDPLNYDLLQFNTAGLDGVHCWLGRVGYLPGDYRIVRNPQNTGSTYTGQIEDLSIRMLHDKAPLSVTIGQLMMLHKMSSLDVLKLDCEGAEEDILNHISDATLAKINRIVGEIHTNPQTFMKFTEGRLFKAGFRMTFQQHPGDASLFYMHAWRDGVE